MTRKADRKPLHLNAFLMSVGHHEAAWRLPESPASGGTDIDHYKNLARIAERGQLDSLFLADSPVLQGDPGRRPVSKLEPTVLLTALAGVTEHIGLIATASTSYNEPYNLARRFASVDHVSGGRAGWNIVTTAGADAARNFGLDDTPLHRDRYLRAAEFVDVAHQAVGQLGRRRGARRQGERRARARRPGAQVRAQGRRTSGWTARSTCSAPRRVTRCWCRPAPARTARTSPPATPRRCSPRSRPWRRRIAFYKDVKERAAGFGRDPEGIKILPGIVPVIGDTEEQARALDEELDRLIRPEYAKRQLANLLQARPRPARPRPRTARRHCRPRTRSRAPRAATPWSSSWPGASG